MENIFKYKNNLPLFFSLSSPRFYSNMFKFQWHLNYYFEFYMFITYTLYIDL